MAAATSSLMVLFSSSAALISFAVDGRVNGAYSGIFSAAAVVASLVGVLVINDRVREQREHLALECTEFRSDKKVQK